MAGTATEAPRRSAWNCISRSLWVMPPSTRNSPSCASPVSASMDCARSYVWYALASSTARAMCPLVEKRVRPGDHAACVVAPEGCAEAGERRDDYHDFRAVARAGAGLDLTRVSDEPEVFPPPW